MSSRPMQMRIIENRLNALEAVARFTAGCNCRFSQETFFHSVADLERIMNVRCPVHLFSDLGELSWVPTGMPLRTEDRPLCCCSPSPTREWLECKREPLTEEEQLRECQSWVQELTADLETEARIEVLLKAYFSAKRRHNENMQR